MAECESVAEKRTFADLKKAAQDKWAYIFEDLLKDKLTEAMATAPFHVACPVHGGTDGFRLFEDYAKTGGGVCNTCGAKKDGFAILAWIKEYDYKEAVKEVSNWVDNDTGNYAKYSPVVEARKAFILPKDPQKAYADIRKIWTASLPLQGSIAERYLLERGIWKENLSSALRFHPSVHYYHVKEKKSYGNFPCLLAPIKDKDGSLVSIHRIFLTPEGLKAPVPDPKKMMSARGDIRGAAIKLFPAEEVLGVAEGIETALAAHAISRMPVWSCVSAPLLELVDIPEYVKFVVIWADLDVSNRGLIAAEKLADRLEAMGKKVEICLPYGPIPEGVKGVDWLDVLLAQGVNGFPARWRRWRPGK